jgi:hypothetical protein
MKLFVYLLFSSSIIFTGCATKNNVAANYSYKTECLGIELDGSQTVKAWGKGRNRMDATEQAKKNAVRDVLFKGIVNGKSECSQIPVVAEVNAQMKYEDYFNKFFTDGGEYLNFISLKDERISQKLTRDSKRSEDEVVNGIVVLVLRSELKKKMIDDGILKK